MVIKKHKIKKYNSGGMRPNPHTASGYSKASKSTKTVNVGSNDQKQVTSTNINKGATGSNDQKNQTSNRTILPVSMTLAKAFVIDPIVKGVRQKQVKGETIFGKVRKGQEGFPISRDYYRQFGKPIDVMSPHGKQYMKDAGFIKPTPPGGTPDNDPKQLCPDGTFPPCKTPVTQIKNPVTTNKNSFLSGFKAYDDGGEVVISSNVDKDLL